jgi:nicotinamidase-related amidase
MAGLLDRYPGATLLIVDIQNDYFPGGAMELEGAEAAAERAGEALAVFRKEGLPVVHVRHLAAQPGATFFRPNTAGAQIHASVQPAPGEALIEKNYPNSFRQTGLQAWLEQRGARNLVVAGMMTHMCVDATVRHAADLGYPIALLADACATRAQSFAGEVIPARQVHGAFLAALGGFYASLVQTAEL